MSNNILNNLLIGSADYKRENPGLIKKYDRANAYSTQKMIDDHREQIILDYNGENEAATDLAVWIQQIQNIIKKTYPNHHEYFTSNKDWEPEEINYADYAKVDERNIDDENINIKNKNKLRIRIDKVTENNNNMVQQRKDIFDYIMRRLSNKSKNHIEAMDKFKNANQTNGDYNDKSPYLLMKLILESHSGGQASIKESVHVIRQKHKIIFDSFKRGPHEDLAIFMPRLKSLKDTMDTFSNSTPIRDDDGDKIIVPIVSGDEILYADKLVSEYQKVYPSTIKEYRTEVARNKMKSFKTIQEAYDWIIKMAAAGHEQPKFPESPPAKVPGSNPANPNKRARHTYLIKSQGTGFESEHDDSGAKSNSKLNPCHHCVRNFTDIYQFQPSEDTRNQFRHLYPRDCPLMKSAPPKADKEVKDIDGKAKFNRKRGRDDIEGSKDDGNNKKKVTFKGNPFKGRKGAGKGANANKNVKRNVKPNFGTDDNE